MRYAHALTLVHLLGRNPAANEAVAGLLREALVDVPREHRSTIAAIGRDFASLARKNLRKSGAAESSTLVNPLQARKDLNSMGLTYYDSKQFLDAVKRNDVLAVELYVAGGGVDLASRDFWGRDALEIARANGNARIADLLARNLPAGR